MSKIITLDRVRTVLKEVADERPEHVQPRCAYLSAGRHDERNPHITVEGYYVGPVVKEVVCVAAQVFHRIDPDINVDLFDAHAGGIGVCNDSTAEIDEPRYPTIAAQVLIRYGFTDEAINYLGVAQYHADEVRPWATAYERAEESL